MQKYCKISIYNHYRLIIHQKFVKTIDNYKIINKSIYYQIHIKNPISINKIIPINIKKFQNIQINHIYPQYQ